MTLESGAIVFLCWKQLTTLLVKADHPKVPYPPKITNITVGRENTICIVFVII